MDVKNKFRINFEYIIILVFIFLFISIGLSNNWDKRLSHTSPYSYLASDAFFHMAVADYAIKQGRYHFVAPYIVGGHEKTINQHPPAVFELAMVFSDFTDLKAYDSIYFIAFFMLLLFVLVAYIIWRQANKYIAMLSLPITILIFKPGFSVLILWGYWMFAVGLTFMVASMWAISKIGLKHSYILMGLFFGATFLAHPPEAVFVVGFLMLYFIITLISTKKIDINFLKKSIISGIITFVLSFYSFIIFSKTMLKIEGYRNEWVFEHMKGGMPDIFLKTLGIGWYTAVIGLILFFLIKSKKKSISPAIFSIYCFSLGYLIWLGLGKRSYSHRLVWFVYLAFFFGFALYTVTKLATNKIYKPIVFILSIILLVIFAKPLHGKGVSQGVMNQYNWEALKWISNNTPEDAYIYYFYSNALSHNAPLYSSERTPFNIITDTFVDAVKSNKIQRNYTFKLAKGYRLHVKELKPIFSYCYYPNVLDLSRYDPEYKCVSKAVGQTGEPPPNNFLNRDICAIEYLHFDKSSSPPVLAQYNMAIANMLLKNSWIKEIYSNPLVSILKNEKPGVDCFGNFTKD